MVDEDPKPDAEINKKETAADHNKIECVIAVMSGKGGVGKSFVTGLLASGLARAGYQTGILDADITGPSIPMLYGLHGPVKVGKYGILPLKSSSGIKVISMNLLLASEDQPVIWRGPLISKAIKQLWEDVMWGKLDYLLIDLPPGTSDAALTIMQSMPVKGVIMVTTPQGLAGLIVKKAVHMAQSVGIPIIGVIENMAYFRCPDTGKQHFIFGPSHAEVVASAAHAPVLGQIPIDPFVSELCDTGKIEDVVLDESSSLIHTFVNAVPISEEEPLLREARIVIEKKTAKAPGGRSSEKITLQADDPNASRKRSESKSYSKKALQLIESKANMGSLENPDARGSFRGSCGDSMQIELRLAGEIIQEARYITDGCEATIACGGMVTNLARSKTLAEAIQIQPEDVKTALDGLPKNHEHCADLAVNTLRAAVKNAIEG
jgi:Mrp family chromosome partitioning ATPase/NifU-like protein involved in Fe-S cluster formation